MDAKTIAEVERLKDQMEAAKEIMASSLESISDGNKIFKYAAKCYRKLYEELVLQGFSREEAMQIVERYSPLSR